MTPEKLRNILAYYTGSEIWYRHALNRNVLYTEGAQAFADNAEAYWFLDFLATEPAILAQAKEFASITLTVADSEADIVVTDGNDTTVFSRHIDFTTCPEGEWRFFFIDNVILLPSEY